MIIYQKFSCTEYPVFRSLVAPDTLRIGWGWGQLGGVGAELHGRPVGGVPATVDRWGEGILSGLPRSGFPGPGLGPSQAHKALSGPWAKEAGGPDQPMTAPPALGHIGLTRTPAQPVCLFPRREPQTGSGAWGWGAGSRLPAAHPPGPIPPHCHPGSSGPCCHQGPCRRVSPVPAAPRRPGGIRGLRRAHLAGTLMRKARARRQGHMCP